MATDTKIVAARREALRAWITHKFGGVAAAFIEDARKRGHEINQGELSGLLRDKSFGERRAIKLEAQAGMPDGHLSRPLDTVTPGDDPGIIELRQLVGLMAQALVASTPVAGRDLVAAIRQKLAPQKGSFSAAVVDAAEAELAGIADTFPRKRNVSGSR